MKVMYARQYEVDPPASALFPRPWIFLAGPTERRDIRTLWRLEFVEMAAMRDFAGTLIIPEDQDGVYKGGHLAEPSFGNQVEWEWWGLDNANTIAFWVPRNMVLLPGMTTNVEFGMYVSSGKVVYGRPDDAEQCTYVDKLARHNGVYSTNSLEALVETSIQLCS